MVRRVDGQHYSQQMDSRQCLESSAYQEKHKQHTQMRTLELDKIQNFTDFEADFVGNGKATYMRLSV
jgi:hypothetical protein